MHLADLLTAAGGILLLFLIVIWAMWRTRWIVGGAGVIAAMSGYLVLVRLLAGASPILHGLMLGVALFLGSAMMLMGVIAWAMSALAARERS